MAVSEIDYVGHKLLEIATQSYNLAMGLQNAAPPQSSPGPSIQYLKDISVFLEKTSRKINELKGT